MSLKHVVSCMACLMLSLGGAATARAETYALTGGGGQLAIGDEPPLPVQVLTPGVTGTVFPPLGIPAKIGVSIPGTTVMTKQQRITLPTGVLSRPAQRGTVGVFIHNPTLYAVATNLGFVWPAAPAVLSTQARTGPKTTTFSALGGFIRYSNSLASKFGGPAQFAISYGPPGRWIPAAPVTLYAIALPPMGNPPCTHTVLVPPFPGTYTNPYCIAVLGGEWPPLQAVIGGPVGVFASTSPLSWPLPGIGIGKFGTNPTGTVDFFTFTPSGTLSGFTNMVSSVGFPWTTGMITISQPAALGAPEFYTLTGMDNRTPRGAGTLQLVSGGLSLRAVSGPNANRGWVRLQMIRKPRPLPTMSPAGLAAAAGLMLLAVAYALRRKLSA